MEFLGEIERAFARLYPYRVPIAIGLVVVVALLAWVGYRRGWFAAAWRRRRLLALIGVPLFIVLTPVAWYLGSPLFIRSELNEPPAAESSPALDGSARILASGEFSGADEFHFGRGRALILESDGGLVLRLEDFSVRNGPDLYVYLSPSPDGYADGALELGPLKATDGSFNYEIPAGTDISPYRSAVVWCKPFEVLFAHAPLAPPAE